MRRTLNLKFGLATVLFLLPTPRLSTAHAAEAELVAWGTAERGTSATSFSISGRVIAKDGALNVVSARVQGRILAILHREGEYVPARTPIFSVSSGECSSLAAEKRVAEKRGGSELIESTQKREGELGIKLQANDCFLLTSQAGVLTKRNVEVGSSFNSGDGLISVLDTSRLGVELDIPERDLPRIKIGMKTRLRLASDPDRIYVGQIATILPSIDPATRVAKARLGDVKLPPYATLDSLVFGEIETASSAPILKVPSAGLVFHRNRTFVVKKNEKSALQAVPVQVLFEASGSANVRPDHDLDLKAGDAIATKGAIFLLKDLVHQDPS